MCGTSPFWLNMFPCFALTSHIFLFILMSWWKIWKEQPKKKYLLRGMPSFTCPDCQKVTFQGFRFLPSPRPAIWIQPRGHTHRGKQQPNASIHGETKRSPPFIIFSRLPARTKKAVSLVISGNAPLPSWYLYVPSSGRPWWTWWHGANSFFKHMIGHERLQIKTLRFFGVILLHFHISLKKKIVIIIISAIKRLIRCCSIVKWEWILGWARHSHSFATVSLPPCTVLSFMKSL